MEAGSSSDAARFRHEEELVITPARTKIAARRRACTKTGTAIASPTDSRSTAAQDGPLGQQAQQLAGQTQAHDKAGNGHLAGIFVDLATHQLDH